VRLLNRLVRRLPEGHAWSDTRADDIPLGAAMDRIEEMVLEAAKQEGLAPSFDNLPPSGELISRERADDAGGRVTEWFGRESFIKGMNTPGRKVAAIVDRKSNQVIWGRPFERALIVAEPPLALPAGRQAFNATESQHDPRGQKSVVLRRQRAAQRL
jgi:hypothetical protein